MQLLNGSNSGLQNSQSAQNNWPNHIHLVSKYRRKTINFHLASVPLNESLTTVGVNNNLNFKT